VKDAAGPARPTPWWDALVPIGISMLILGLVAGITIVPGTFATIEVFDTESWIAAREEAREEVRAPRRELVRTLRSEVGLLTRTEEEVRALLGPPELVRRNESDGVVEWVWPIARDRVGSPDLIVLIAGFDPETGRVSSVVTDVERLPPP